MQDLQILLDEFAGPEYVGLATSSEKAGLFLAKTTAQSQRVLTADLEMYLSSIGKLNTIYDLVSAGTNPEHIAARSLSNLINGRRNDVDVNHSLFHGALSALVSALVLDQAHADTITSLGTEIIPLWQSMGAKNNRAWLISIIDKYGL